jgi:hypothetical protein
MTSMLVCFNLGVPVEDQTQQISFWLDFLNSSLPLPPLPATPDAIPKWNIILVGVHQDKQQDFSLTQNPNLISQWKKRWSRLPLAPILFAVSSLKSQESVQHLLKFVEDECGRIFDTHCTQIPSSYRNFLSKLQFLSTQHPLIHWSELFNKLKPHIKMEEQAFKVMLKYAEAIGRIVWLPTGVVLTDHTFASKIAAKFISPKKVRLELLKQETDRVHILDQTEIGCLLDIDYSENERYFQLSGTCLQFIILLDCFISLLLWYT